ncbi:MAG TPA: flagellar hook capping FlgD N-terminal domain-containing protein [Terriglobales bacterium]|jgi:flagellar basal-body rod modification protein FlgD|nr:flagellar hook capping FlgD N-terminal domain-containing protein [Terriglobales bacterium]
MDIAGIVQASTTNPGATSTSKATQQSKDMFLTLLVTQLKAQDPLSPMDANQMVGQMLSMNQLDQLIEIRKTLQGDPSVPQSTSAVTGAN